MTEFERWDQQPFQDAMSAGNLDQVWTLLSNCAEDLVCTPDARAVPA